MWESARSQLTLLTQELITERICSVPFLALRVKRRPVVRRELDAVLNSEGQVRRTDEVSAKCNADIFGSVHFVNDTLRLSGVKSSSDQDGSLRAPHLNVLVVLVRDGIGGVDGVNGGLPANAGLDKMEVGQVELLEFIDDVRELRKAVWSGFQALTVEEW